MKIDPYKNKEKYLNWKNQTQSAIPKITKANSDLIKQYLQDMEQGINVASSTKRGSRSYIRLNVLRQRMVFIAREFEKRFNLNLMTEVSEQQLFNFFLDMRNGVIAKKGGEKYKSIKDYVIDFKAFWHWHQKINRKREIEIKDITLDLDTSGEKPDWVYLTEEQVKRLADTAIQDYKVLIWFLFDSGIRAPTEFMNIKVSDFYNEFKELNIREEVSKTFGRRIKLLICSTLIKDYVQNNGLGKDDYLFTKGPYSVNKYLKRLARRLFGDERSPAGAKYSDLTMYDFRHCSCCYWLPRYKSESALKYRFGWKNSDKIHYYSELLGMSDTIAEDDLLTDVTKVELEKRLDKAERDNLMLREDNGLMKVQMAKIGELVKILFTDMKIKQGMEL